MVDVLLKFVDPKVPWLFIISLPWVLPLEKIFVSLKTNKNYIGADGLCCHLSTELEEGLLTLYTAIVSEFLYLESYRYTIWGLAFQVIQNLPKLDLRGRHLEVDRRISTFKKMWYVPCLHHFPHYVIIAD